MSRSEISQKAHSFGPLSNKFGTLPRIKGSAIKSLS